MNQRLPLQTTIRCDLGQRDRGSAGSSRVPSVLWHFYLRPFAEHPRGEFQHHRNYTSRSNIVTARASLART